MFFYILAAFAKAEFYILPSAFCLSFFGGHKAVVRPDPIPNSAVKHSLADGSGFIDSARVGCRQILSKGRDICLGLFCYSLCFRILAPEVLVELLANTGWTERVEERAV